MPPLFTASAVRLLRVLLQFAIKPRDFVPPRKALILKPCCMSQVMLATPLVRQLKLAYPNAQFDWAVSNWARQAVATNERITALVPTGSVGLPSASWREILAFSQSLRSMGYDTCFVPSSSAVLSLVAWLAHIPQRIGLDIDGRGLAHTLRVRPPEGERHSARLYLALAEALGLDTSTARAEFSPPNRSRTSVTERLVDEFGWLGDDPLIIMHPGGGENPVEPNALVRWPVERFARLGNYLAREHKAKVLVVGGMMDKPHAEAVVGLMSAKAHNLAGKLDLAELAAVCEMANLYVGNDAGPTHIAVAVGCPTLAIYGPTNPAVSRPFAVGSLLTTLWHEFEGEFSWEKGVTTAEATAAAVALLAQSGGRRLQT